MLAAISIGNWNELVKAQEDHYPGHHARGCRQQPVIEEGIEQKHGQDRSKRLSHASGKRDQAGFLPVGCGTVKGDAAGQPFWDVMDCDGDCHWYPEAKVG